MERVRHGPETRRLLHRLLRIPDGAAVHGRRRKYLVNCGHRGARVAGETCAEGIARRQNGGRVSHVVGRVDDGGALTEPSSVANYRGKRFLQRFRLFV
jgi:hypothetical protein